MRAIFVISLLVELVSSCLAIAEPPRRSYTTLVIEFVGEMDRPVSPIVVSTSSEAYGTECLLDGGKK
jgi:hypothetical protein